MKKAKNSGLVVADDWEARDDMRTLMRAAAIRRDPKRLKAARAAARKQLEEQQAETAQMRALAKPQ